MPAVLRVEDSTVMLNGLRFHYRDWRNDGAPPMLVLHALGDCARDWDSFAEAFSTDFRVLALDQRGHGETGWAGDYHSDVWVEDLEAFARQLRLRAMAVVGHGMGARHAWRFAAQHRELVKRLVLVDEPPTSAGPLDDSGAGAAVFRSPEEALRTFASGLPWAEERHLRRWVVHKFREGAPGQWELRWDGRMCRPPHPVHDAEADARLRKQVTTPTLVVQSAADARAAVAPGGITGERRVKLTDSHHPLLQQPDALLAAVGDWL